MNKIVKISSNEGGVLTANNNRVSFNIPDDKFYDLSKSYIQLISSVTPEAGKGVVCAGIQYDFDDGTRHIAYHRNSVLVKNINFSNMMGSVENIQRSDILSSAMANYEEDDDAVVSHEFQDLFKVQPTSQAVDGMFVDLNREGVVNSRNVREQPVRIRCAELMNFWKTKQYNAMKYGKGRLEMELNIGKITPVQLLGATGIDAAGAHSGAAFDGPSLVPWEQGAQKLNNFINLSETIGPDGLSVQIGATTVPHVFNRLEDCGLFWVGQQITIKGTATGTDRGVAGLAAGVVRTITAISYNRGEPDTNNPPVGMTGAFENPGSITLSLDITIFTQTLGAGEGMSLLQCVGVDATFDNFQVDYAELVLEEVANPDTSAGANQPIAYTSYRTEEFDTAITQNFQRVFTCEPEAKTLYITSPYYDFGDADKIATHSYQSSFDNYRIRIDNKDTTSRNIALRATGRTNDPLHIQKQLTALNNSGKRLRNLLENTQRTGYVVSGQDYNQNVGLMDVTQSRLLIAQVLPVTQREKQVQIIINSPQGKGVKRLVLFKEVNRVI
tara:strand:+ start:316 stop:1980 length:1665 start_codon:yes stop_codon:yes gene_type:complete